MDANHMLVVVLGVLLLRGLTAYTLVKLGSFQIQNPGFTNLYPKAGSNGTVDLLISTFNAIPFSNDSVQIVPNVGANLGNVSAIVPKVVTNKVTWPNEIVGVPENVFGKRMVIIPQGFLVPFKTNGAIEVVDISSSVPTGPNRLTDDQEGHWFYHRVLWEDMDGDGDTDIVTCRAREPVTGIGKDSELLWLENNGNFQSPWIPHILAHGPDIYFRILHLNTTDGIKECILTAQFFTKMLSVYWTEAVNSIWTNSSQLHSRVIDNTIGSVFEVITADLNADGNVDLLVTESGAAGAMYAYEIPQDFRTQNFIKHTIATGFKPKTAGIGKGAPGSPMVVFPDVKNQNGTKPHILLSGDDEGTAYYFAPVNATSAQHWQYNMTVFLNASRGTVGQLAAGDVDGDGLTEVFVPSYSTNELFVYRFHQ